MIDLTADVDNLKIQNFEIERKILIERLKKNDEIEKNIKKFEEEIKKRSVEYPIMQVNKIFHNTSFANDIKKAYNGIYSMDFLKYMERNIETLMKEYLRKSFEEAKNNKFQRVLLRKKRILFKTKKNVQIPNTNRREITKQEKRSKIFSTFTITRKSPSKKDFNNRCLSKNHALSKKEIDSLFKADEQQMIIDLNSEIEDCRQIKIQSCDLNQLESFNNKTMLV